MWGRFLPQPLDGVLTHPAILPAARKLAIDVIEQTHQRDESGRRLSVTSAAAVLQNLVSAWRRDPEIVDRVWSLLDADPEHGFVALLGATHGAELSASRMEYLRARVRADLEALVSSPSEPELDAIFNAEHEVEWIEQRRLVNEFDDILRALGRLNHRLGWCALAVRWPAMSESERAESSRIVAHCAIEASSTSLPLVYLERFVHAAPGAWCDELVAAIEDHGDIDGTLGVQALDLLPRDLQLRAVRAIQSSWRAAQELPWRSCGVAGECARPADTVRRLLFELGEEVLPRSERPLL